MKTIGLITLWSKNYGSILQCYATKKIIEKNGLRCEVLYQNESGGYGYYYKIKKLLSISVNSILYPAYLRNFLQTRKSAKKSKASVSKETAKRMDDFVRVNISPRGVSYKQIEKEAHSQKYQAFIVGSDQIWSGVVPYNPFSFLMFAPKEKRIAYAPSFGTDSIEKYNKNKFRKSINTFSRLSVRENQGVNIIDELCGISVSQMPDPTILLTLEEWNSMICKRIEDKYILLHFLDRPSENALAVIQLLKSKWQIRLICIGYPREELKALGAEFIDAGPYEYLACIFNAAYICTDSFHTTLFSIRSERQFYVFPRLYQNGYNQSSRITSLLEDCDYVERYIQSTPSSIEDIPHNIHSCKSYFEEQRIKALDYIESSIKNGAPSPKMIPRLKAYYDCTGCGACREKCPKNAIQMVYNENGFCVPSVDPSKCIKCGLCESACSLNVIGEDYKKEGYFAYSKNEVIENSCASGGVFATIAKSIIENNGVAVGAQISYDNNKVTVEHKLAHNFYELQPLLKSKYVQSECWHVFKEVRLLLNEGRIVLFSGTSCQVAALYRFLGKKYENLYTIDLICHGVPGTKFFQDYIIYLEEKQRSRVVSFDFRQKNNNKIHYVETVRFENGEIVETPWNESIFYKQFLHRSSYRDSCYQCEYASINKPSDITIGDYFEIKKDYPELYEQYKLSEINGLSCIIVNTEKGKHLLNEYGKGLAAIIVDYKKIQLSHDQLCFSSSPSTFRDKLFDMYKNGGFKRIDGYYKKRNLILYFPKIVYSFLKH